MPPVHTDEGNSATATEAGCSAEGLGQEDGESRFRHFADAYGELLVPDLGEAREATGIGTLLGGL